MCRKCGEPDQRGSAKRRRGRAERLLNGRYNSVGGNGVITVCVWCFCLVGARAGYLEVRLPDGTRRRLRVRKMEQDRLGGLGTPYSLWNLVPACGPCNFGRTLTDFEIPEGCRYGPEARDKIERRTTPTVIINTDFVESAPE